MPHRTTPTPHIFTLQIGQVLGRIDLPNSLENEFLCMKLLEALGVQSAQKYQNEGDPSPADLLGMLSAPNSAKESRLASLQTQILFWSMAATGGLAKNHNLFLQPSSELELAPQSNVKTLAPEIAGQQLELPNVKMSMGPSTRNHYRLDQLDLKHFEQPTHKVGLPRHAALELLRDINNNFDQAWAKVIGNLPDDFELGLAETIKLEVI